VGAKVDEFWGICPARKERGEASLAGYSIRPRSLVQKLSLSGRPPGQPPPQSSVSFAMRSRYDGRAIAGYPEIDKSADGANPGSAAGPEHPTAERAEDAEEDQ
jgi:hypothetical protein